ncbi:type IV secretory system conjugative DNA transfer family protein (plasmid) [Paenibacillus sp. RS8]|uniref:type IV secretory system conjugative DNA transfer family protein n=1 Tax=Paenibacillus sp. RS8 TaxID=3242681 RepID=UPI0035C21A76
MKFFGMILGGILSAFGHMFGFIFKNVYIEIRRFSMDPANKNTLWNIQAFLLLGFFMINFFWLIGKYQDQFYGLSDPVFYRAIPLLIPCFLGHIIYSCPILFKNNYSKPIIQTFLNGLSSLALGQIIMRFLPYTMGLIIAVVIFIAVITLTLYYTLHFNVKSTTFHKLTAAVEQSEISSSKNNRNKSVLNMVKRKDSISEEELYEFDGIDLNKEGCLSHFRYYSEECRLDLFHTIPTKERQSQQMSLNRNDRAQHEQILGGTGAGKTVLATNLIVQDLLNDYIGSTIIEPKGSLINRLAHFLTRVGRPFRRLDPQCETTDCLNPLFVPEGEDIEPMIEANVSAFHGYLGPDAEIFFKNRSTNLMRVCIKALKLAYGNNCGYNELDRLVQPMNDDYRAEVLSVIIEKGFEKQVGLLREYTRNMAANEKTREYTEKTNSNLYDYLTMLTSNRHIQKILCGPSTFNIDDAIKNGEIILVNGAYGTLQTLTYTVGRLFINLVRASTFRRDIKGEIRPHQITIDEIEMFADEEFSTFLEMAREFEVFVRVIHQGNEQLNDVSKRLGAMVKQNAVQKYLLAGLENEDADYYASMIGEFYEIGQSSGTDEMSTTGFKTQIKEEKRFKVLPSEILHLKGYNPETGESGECLFRQVHNNVRLEPVKGLFKPLPRVLFSPLVSEKTEDDNNLVDEELYSSDDFEDLHDNETSNVENEQQIILEKLKKKASDKRRDENESESVKINDTLNIDGTEMTEKNVIRNPLWDSEEDVTDSTSEEMGVETTKLNVTYKPAGIDDKTLLVAQKIRKISEEARNKK